MRKWNRKLFMNLKAHAKGTGFFDARFFRRARRHGSTAGETPAATPPLPYRRNRTGG
jgi:hypothetical protein